MEQITVQQASPPCQSSPSKSSSASEQSPQKEIEEGQAKQEERSRALLEDKEYEDEYLEDLDEQEDNSEIQKVLTMISQSRPVVIIPPEHDLALIDQKPDFIYLEDQKIADTLNEWSSSGVTALQEANFISAAKDLSQAEQLVNAIHYSFKAIPPQFRQSSIQVMLNLAILYYRVGFLEESYASFMNANQMLTQQISLYQTNKPLSISQIYTLIQQEQQYIKLVNHIDLQICILLSELGKNPEALEYSRKAALANYYIFLTSLFILLHSIYKIFPSPLQQQQQQPQPQSQPFKSLKRPSTKSGYGQGQFIVRKGNVRQGVQQQPDEPNKNRNGSAKRGLSNTSQPGNQLSLTSQKIEVPIIKLSPEEEEKVKTLVYLYQIYQSTKGLILTNKSGLQQTLISDITLQIDSMVNHLSSHNISLDQSPPDMNSLFSSIPPEDPLYESTILSVLQMKPQKITFTSPDTYTCNYLQDVIIMALSYYCNSTELRFIEEKQKLYLREQILSMDKDTDINNPNLQPPRRICESELMLGVSMLVVYQYLKHDIPLVGQIISVYNRAYGLNQQPIYEDDQCEYTYRYLKTIQGGSKVIGFAPILRFIKNYDGLCQETQRTEENEKEKEKEKEKDKVMLMGRTDKEKERIREKVKDKQVIKVEKEKVVKLENAKDKELQDRREKRMQRNIHLKENQNAKEHNSQQLVIQQQQIQLGSLKKTDSKKELQQNNKYNHTTTNTYNTSYNNNQNNQNHLQINSQNNVNSVNVRNLTFNSQNKQKTQVKSVNMTAKSQGNKKVSTNNVYQLNKIYQTKEKEKKKKTQEQPMDIQINNYINIFFNNDKQQGNNNELNKLILPNVMRNNKMKNKIN